jgi:uncharacterized Tic20 family protein
MADTTPGGAPTLTIALRGGDSLALWPDRLSVAGTSYPLAQIAWAGLVADPAGMQPAPAVGLRMRDGATPIFVPADPPDAWRLLDALFMWRPDLRMPPPPQGAFAGYAPPPPPPPPPMYGYGYAYAPYGTPWAARAGTNDTTLAGIAHLSVFFAPVILPLILWLVTRESLPYASRQAKQAFFFHLGFWVLTVVVFVVGYAFFLATMFGTAGTLDPNTTGPSPAVFGSFSAIFVLWGVVGVLSLVNIIFSSIGAIQAFQGKDFHYPLLGGL